MRPASPYGKVLVRPWRRWAFTVRRCATTALIRAATQHGEVLARLRHGLSATTALRREAPQHIEVLAPLSHGQIAMTAMLVGRNCSTGGDRHSEEVLAWSAYGQIATTAMVVE